MSIRVMTAAWAVDLPATDKLVLLALADCANDEGTCWPGLASLVSKTGKCKRSLQESLRALDKAGHITRKENPGKGMLYTVHPVAKPATGSKTCTGSKKTQEGVARSAPKPSGTVISGKAKASPQCARAKFAAPDGVSSDQWKAFRQQRKKALNDRSYTLLCNKLRDLAEDGYPPGEMIDLATERGWETVFKPRDSRNDRPSQQPASRNTAAFEYSMRGIDPSAPM